MLRRLPLPAVTVLLAVAAAAPLAAERLAEGVELIRGTHVPGSQPDGNTVVFTAPAGLVVVDTGRHPAHTQKILDFAAGQGEPIVAILNTHWHLDHIGGNAVVREKHPRAKLYATGAIAAARTGFLANYRKQLEGLIASERTSAQDKDGYRLELARIDVSAAIDPEVVVAEGKIPREVAGRALQLHASPGATESDLWLLDSASGVLVAGDLVTLPAPFLDTACPKLWQASLAKVADSGFTTLVPGHGPPMDRAAFTRWRAAFDNLLACAAATERAAGDCTRGWLADAGSLVAESARPLATDLLGYYVNLLRKPEVQQCG